ncbi:aspartyl protease family protein At5g10770-like [Dendrobium catenatum]|uniref:aspartyl protease family protein At5g10770-like n=1 Tax=Dendrobium catenatum TaxID=906689 RepID=UPI0009F2FCC8|nr:aspartyl protease family protein At5g10770-like [Dendrobium catenatum]
MPSFYFLNLTAISVGGEMLTLPPTIFSGPETMLDSGTAFSYLPPTAYSALRMMTNLHSTGRIFHFSESQACLPFVENEDDSEVVIIGNMQHLTFNVVYDVGNSQIGFGPNGCS